MPAHPLAAELIERLHERKAVRVLDFGSGKGRNAAALRAASLLVHEVADAAAAGRAALDRLAEPFDAVLATHALLHGTPQSTAERVDAIARVLRAGGLFYATFASVRDARYGKGARLAEQTFAPADGDERGIAHVYYDEPRLRAILTPYFALESIEERDVDGVAGRWAHPTTPLRGAVHWLVRAVATSA